MWSKEKCIKNFGLQTGRENACCDIVYWCSREYNWISERSGRFVDWRYITKKRVQWQIVSTVTQLLVS